MVLVDPVSQIVVLDGGKVNTLCGTLLNSAHVM